MIYDIPQGCFTDLVLEWSEKYIRQPDSVIHGDPNETPVGLEYVTELIPVEQSILSTIFIAAQAKENYSVLPDWVKTGTADQAETYINGQIWNGLTLAQVQAYIDSTIANITTANVVQINTQLANIRTVFKAAAGAIIAMRGMFIITAKLLIYVRDLIIRFRGG